MVVKKKLQRQNCYNGKTTVSLFEAIAAAAVAVAAAATAAAATSVAYDLLLLLLRLHGIFPCESKRHDMKLNEALHFTSCHDENGRRSKKLAQFCAQLSSMREYFFLPLYFSGSKIFCGKKLLWLVQVTEFCIYDIFPNFCVSVRLCLSYTTLKVEITGKN